MKQILKFLGSNWFFVGLFLVIVIGLTSPEAGAAVKDFLTPLIVVGMFLIGSRIERGSLAALSCNIRALILCCFLGFVLMPVLSFVLGQVFFQQYREMYVGIILTGAVATTQASSIIWTDICRGNRALAVVLMTVSNVGGVFVLPFILLLALGTVVAIPTADILETLCLAILLPLIVGCLAGPRLGLGSPMVRRFGQVVNILIIWLVILAALSSARIEWEILPLVLLCAAAQYLLIAGLSFYSSKRLGMSREDSISVMFCSTQKTITVAALIGLSYFSSGTLVYGLVYHIFQQIMGNVTARALSNELPAARSTKN